MDVRDQAWQLAESGRYEDAGAVIFALFKLGYGRAPTTFGLVDRMRLTQLCRASSRRNRMAER
ncbi:hypothetical protein HL653_14520 [Sphingomonas sp. AP4-R1]|uniref:hypothetical protein n=1 Tax=Sphingomonas sp. AP4-R1 TaxID=2735134 RepID=UPI0014934C36|nr:hypothetical protein [Sphingomonas sp. AP4-R1]QJU58817.1 hypothetical protein HL653_14520 [Sphingomonas sp. AP4-R1]